MRTPPSPRFDQRILPARPRRLLVASDLHLGSGLDPVTGTWAATENFLADDAFAAWLHHYGQGPQDTLLVLNGDILDWVRVSEVPGDDDFEAWSACLCALGSGSSANRLRHSLTFRERRY